MLKMRVIRLSLRYPKHHFKGVALPARISSRQQYGNPPIVQLAGCSTPMLPNEHPFPHCLTLLHYTVYIKGSCLRSSIRADSLCSGFFVGGQLPEAGV